MDAPGFEPGTFLACPARFIRLTWTVQDSNLRPSACKADALPTELTVLKKSGGVNKQSASRPEVELPRIRVVQGCPIPSSLSERLDFYS